MKPRSPRLWCCTSACVLALGLFTHPSHAQGTVVSITFDDAIDDTVTDDGPATSLDNVYRMASSVLTDGDVVANELSCPNVGTLGSTSQLGESTDCDLPATFFLNSPRLDTSKFFTQQQVREMDAMGHEIGGHSAHHLEIPNLESSSTDRLDLNEQGLQICWDRERLSLIPKLDGSGTLALTSFAYPFGENTWIGAESLTARFGVSSPALIGNETQSIVGEVGRCAYRSARTTTGAANTPECTDGDPATPCVWAEATKPPNPFALRVPSSYNYGMALDYPVVPVNDDGNGIYDRPEEFESRADSIKGWVDNAIAHPSDSGKNWVILTFHTVCFAYHCNQYGIEYHEFANLMTWLRQKRLAGEIEISTMRQVLKQTNEYRVVTPPIPEAPSAVRNAQMSADVNRDFIPDCFDSSGTGIFHGPIVSNPIFADADENENGVADDGFRSDRWYGWLVMAGGTTRGRFFTRTDLGNCAPGVAAPNAYKLSFQYRKPRAPRHCGFSDDVTAAPCPFDLTDAAPTGMQPNYYLIYAFRNHVGPASDHAGNGAWAGYSRVSIPAPTAGVWNEASTVVTTPTGKDAITMGIEIEHDDADGRVDVDVDNFSYCRIGGADSDGVAPCP